MKSKELTLLRLKSQEIKNSEERQKYGRISLISKLETEYLKEVLKDLDELEELKKIMGTPIQEIMKKLKELEAIKKWFIDNTTDYRDYDNTLFVDVFIRKDEQIFKIISEVLDNE